MRCEICGKEIPQSLYSGAVLCSSACFSVHFWRQICSEKEEHLIIDGECYFVDTPALSTKPSSMLGHAGRRFTIRTFDGKIIETNNLWYNGMIPSEFRDQLPDNAMFVWSTDDTPCDY
nr:hypothetical protein [uncultured Lachnoclostridium sp.]